MPPHNDDKGRCETCRNNSYVEAELAIYASKQFPNKTWAWIDRYLRGEHTPREDKQDE